MADNVQATLNELDRRLKAAREDTQKLKGRSPTGTEMKSPGMIRATPNPVMNELDRRLKTADQETRKLNRNTGRTLNR